MSDFEKKILWAARRCW